jgi:hypothetical protein
VVKVVLLSRVDEPAESSSPIESAQIKRERRRKRESLLVKELDKLNRMTRWAISSINILDRVSHVALVIRRVQIHPIPAAREVDLSPHTTRAVVSLEEGVPLSPSGVARVGNGKVEANVGDGGVGEVGRVERLSVGVAGKDTKAGREGFNRVFARAVSREVVSEREERERKG